LSVLIDIGATKKILHVTFAFFFVCVQLKSENSKVTSEMVDDTGGFIRMTNGEWA
jgi:hypothetical protein